MNSVQLLGRMVKDAELRTTNTGKEVASFTLAVSRNYLNADGQRDADFINCQLWGKPAQILSSSVKKGQRVLVEGRLQIRSYDAKDGSKRTVAEVVCNSFEFIESKNSTNNQKSELESMGTMTPFNEEIPF